MATTCDQISSNGAGPEVQPCFSFPIHLDNILYSRPLSISWLLLFKYSVMHESFFNYNVTRPYPYKWFTWVVVLGGVTAAILFSVLNLAANGYQLEVVYTTDPNGTLSEIQWFQKQPWTLMEKVTSSCQPQGLALNTRLFTTQLGFTYELSNVWSFADDGSTVIHPTLTYLNNTLENCIVNNILIDATNTDTLGNGNFWSWETTSISAIATCSVANGDSHSYFNMTVEYDAIPQTDTAHTNGMNGVSLSNTGFLHLDQKNKACLWWGQELLRMWYYNAINGLSQYADGVNSTDSNTIANMMLSLAPVGKTNISSLNFFNATGWFYMGDGSLQAMQSENPSLPLTQVLTTIDVGIQMHHFATVFYSTILSDLGQSYGPNVLTDYAIINEYVLQGYGPYYASLGYDSATTSAQQAFDEVKAATGPLIITPSTFNAQYICQLPRRRSFGSVFIAVLIGDIVFLQALYSVFTLTTAWYLGRTDKRSSYCEGCKKHFAAAAAGQEPDEGMAFLALSPKYSQFSTNTRPRTSGVDVFSQSVVPEQLHGSTFKVVREPVYTSCQQYERVGE